MMVEFFPQIRNDTLADIVHEVGLTVKEDSLDEIEPNDQKWDDEQHLHALVDENFVHCGLNEPGGSSGADGDGDHADHGQDEFHPVRFNELQ